MVAFSVSSSYGSYDDRQQTAYTHLRRSTGTHLRVPPCPRMVNLFLVFATETQLT
jgi:hypothetical protein